MVPGLADVYGLAKSFLDALSWIVRRFRTLLALLVVVTLVLLADRLVEAARTEAGDLVSGLVDHTDTWGSTAIAATGVAALLLLVGAYYLPHRNLWHLRLKTLVATADNIDHTSAVTLDEAEVRRRIQDFSTDASEIMLIAGDGDFLTSDPSQTEELLSYGKKCRVIISPNSELGPELVNRLTAAGVGIRIFPNGQIQGKSDGQLRGRLKRNANGMAACLFDRIGQGFRVVNLENELLVELLENEFEHRYEYGRHPLIRHVIFDIAGVAFDGDVADFFQEVDQLLPVGPMARASDYLILDEDLNTGKTDIVSVVQRRLGRTLQPEESEKIRQS